MDVHEDAIGVWPNVALNPGTHTHAATGEPVEQPDYTKLSWWLGETMHVTMRDGELVVERKVVDR